MAERNAILSGSLEAAAALVSAREISAVELTTLAQDAAESANPSGNAFRVFTRARALAAAQRVDAALGAGDTVGPLAGVPLGMKDLLDMAGEMTAAGSIVLAETPAASDSTAVTRLEAAGATIIGKTSMPEFAFSPASNNDHYGTVPNPWDATRDSGGSSSGSGAAVAAGLVFGATGSDTGGSIRMPASACGIVGLKPTFGAVSASGAETLSWSLDHVGPMTRTVRDAALLFDVLAGPDPGDARTLHTPRSNRSSNTLASVDKGVAGLRIGVLTDDGNGALGTPGVLAGVSAGAAALEAAGAHLTEVAITEFGDLARLYGALLVLEAAAYYERFLRERPDDLTIFARNRMLLAYAYSPTFFVQAQQARGVLRQRINARVADLDLVLLPGMPHEAPPLGIVQSNTRFTGPFNALGWPAIVVPSGRGEGGLPVAAQLAARPWREDLVLRAARVIEQAGIGPGMPG